MSKSIHFILKRVTCAFARIGLSSLFKYATNVLGTVVNSLKFPDCVNLLTYTIVTVTLVDGS